MKRILKLSMYLSQYKTTLFILVLIFLIQQICSLMLPTLMSNIVDTGIRQSGFDHAAPDALSEQALELSTSFMSSVEREKVLSQYAKVEPAERDKYPSLVEKYPILDHQSIYILKKSKLALRNELNGYFSKSTLYLAKYLKHLGKDSTVHFKDENQIYALNLNDLYSMLPKIKTLSYSAILKIQQEQEDIPDIKRVSCELARQYSLELGTDISKVQVKYILRVGSIMFIITLVSIIAAVIENYLSSRLSAGISMKLRSDVFRKVESFSRSEFDEFSVASLITRTTSDVSHVKESIFMMLGAIVPPITLIGGLIMAIRKSPSMSFIIALGAIVAAAILAGAFAIVLPRVKLVQKIIDSFNKVIKERLSGSMVTRIFGTVALERKKFDKSSRELTDLSFFINRVTAYMSPTLTVAMNIISVLIIWMGAQQIAQSTMQVGDLIAFIQYSAIVIGAFLAIVMMFSAIPQAVVSIDRIYEILDKELSIRDPEIPKYFNKPFRGEIAFRNVYFKYKGAESPILKNISFTAKPGQVTAITGPTGSGKSTIINLIPRLYDVTYGKITIDDINIKEIPQKSLREKIGIVPQKSILFSGGIEYNLRYGGNNASKKEILECLNAAQLPEFSKDIMEGSDFIASQGGNNLSGGQKQRLSIARALAKSANICVFDDSFSSLDFKTDSLVRKAIAQKASASTVLIVTQRIGAIMNADSIIVLDKGLVVGRGTHKELVKECPLYREMAEAQLKKKVI